MFVNLNRKGIKIIRNLVTKDNLFRVSFTVHYNRSGTYEIGFHKPVEQTSKIKNSGHDQHRGNDENSNRNSFSFYVYWRTYRWFCIAPLYFNRFNRSGN